MSVSLLEVIESGGYEPMHSVDDARWLLSKQQEFEYLIARAEAVVEDQIEDLVEDE